MKRTIIMVIWYQMQKDEKDKDGDYVDMTSEENLEMLKQFGAKFGTWIESVKDECGISNIDNNFTYNVGNEGVGDAYICGHYQAVDMDCPSTMYVDIEINDKKGVKLLLNKIIKMMPEWEKIIPNLEFYAENASGTILNDYHCAIGIYDEHGNED